MGPFYKKKPAVISMTVVSGLCSPFFYAHLCEFVRAGSVSILTSGLGVPVYMEKVIYNKELMRENGAYFAVGSLTDDYYRGSFFTSFCIMTSGMFGAGKPTDYSRQTVRETAALFELNTQAQQREVLLTHMDFYNALSERAQTLASLSLIHI